MRGARARVRPPEYTLGQAEDLFSRWLPLATSKSGQPYGATTIARYRAELAAFVRDLTPGRDLQGLTADAIAAHLAAMRTAGRTPSYIATRDKVIRVFVRFCLERRMLVEDPLVHVLRQKAPDPPIETFTDAEVRHLLRACPDDTWWGVRARTIIFILWRCGLRASELCRLELEDYDVDRGHLRVKGTKSAAAVRRVGVPEDAAYQLDDWIARGRGTAPGRLIPGERTPAVRREWLTVLVRRIGQRAGVPDVHPHRFRHTFAVNWLRNDGDIYVLQRLLGHSSVAMTMRYLRALKAEEAADMHLALRPGRRR